MRVLVIVRVRLVVRMPIALPRRVFMARQCRLGLSEREEVTVHADVRVAVLATSVTMPG